MPLLGCDMYGFLVCMIKRDAAAAKQHVDIQMGKQIDVEYIDPYAAQIYGVQRAKWDAKRAREAHKQALLDAKLDPVSDEEFMTG